MKYALLIYGTPDEELTPEVMAEYMAISEDDAAYGGEQLQDVGTATTVRVAAGETLLTDGPFVEAKEFLGGFFLVDAPDLDAAIALAARVPAARMGGAVEVRPIVER